MNKKLIAVYLCAVLALALLVGGLSIMTNVMMKSRMNTISADVGESG